MHELVCGTGGSAGNEAADTAFGLYMENFLPNL